MAQSKIAITMAQQTMVPLKKVMEPKIATAQLKIIMVLLRIVTDQKIATMEVLKKAM